MHQPQPTTDPRQAAGDAIAPATRVPALDGIRGLAILLVMGFHFYGLAFGLSGREPDLAVDRFVHDLFRTGWAGVDLFFVLSGFLITGILLDAKGSSGYFRSFFARRVLRIFPLYYGFLLFLLVLAPHLPLNSGAVDADRVRDHQFWYWSYLFNIASGIKSVDAEMSLIHAHFWSLAVEEQFYVVWPFVVLALSRRSLAVFCAALVVGALFVRVFLVSDLASGWAKVNAAHVLTVARVDTLAVGALIAIALRSRAGLAPLRRWVFPAMAGAAAVLVALFVANDGLNVLDREVATVGFSALAVLFGGLLVLVLTSDAEASIVAHPALMFFGRYAYGLYMVHLLIAFDLSSRVIEREWLPTLAGSQIPTNLLLTAAGIGISSAVAWLTWHLYEKQFLKLKRYVPYGRAPGPAPRRGRAAAEPVVAAEGATFSAP